MGNGVRTLSNADGIITDWVRQHFEPVSSLLSAIANPKTTLDLLASVDNSCYGFSVQQGAQKLKQFGLKFPGTAGSQIMFKEPGLTGLSSLTASRLSAVDIFQYVFDCRDLTPGLGHGFATTFNPTGQWFELRVGWPNGSQGIYYQSGMSIIVNRWYVARGVIFPDRNHELMSSDGTAIAVSLAGYLTNAAGNLLMLGANTAGSSVLKGDIGFFGAWGNEFTAGDIVTVIALDINIMTDRRQAI